MSTTVRAFDIVIAKQHGVSIPKYLVRLPLALEVTDRWDHQSMEVLLSLVAVLLSVSYGS